jgi:hypothetical protein
MHERDGSLKNLLPSAAAEEDVTGMSMMWDMYRIRPVSPVLIRYGSGNFTWLTDVADVERSRSVRTWRGCLACSDAKRIISHPLPP